jgi:hypothetical protein
MIRISNAAARSMLCAAILVSIFLSGCATLEEPLRTNLASGPLAVRECANWFQTLDAVIDRAGVRDAGSFRIRGFPYLRVDRFNSSFRDEVADSPQKVAQWIDRMRALDADARTSELRNLPRGAIDDLLGLEQAADRTQRCAERLRQYDFLLPDSARTLAARAQVPDGYQDWQRALGLYALTRIPFATGVARWHEETLADFKRSADGVPPRAPVTRHALSQRPSLPPAQLASIIAHASANPLRIPEFSPEDGNLLAAAFAPVFEIETASEYDRFGALAWGDAPSPVVRSARPLVYFRISHTRYGGQVLPQLVYTIWFSERPSRHAFDMLGGRLDGVVLRVTLSALGEPLLYDSIHPCGCFHMFFPTPRVQPVPPPDDYGEWAFIPKKLPAHHPGTRAVLRIATATHYVVDILPDGGGAAAQAYELAPEAELRVLVAPQGTRSAYGPDGLVPGTERGERLLFWPMGISSAGAMRQWGRHATAFLGRRHFDDHDLVEKRFRILAP